MKVLSFLSVVTCLVFASNFVTAGPKDKQMSYQVDGQTLYSKTLILSRPPFFLRTNEKRNMPVSIKGGGTKVVTMQSYDEGWGYFGENCYIGGAMGNKLSLQGHEWHQTITFSDGSTITELLIEQTVCDLPPANGRLASGTFELKWTVVGGTGRFEGASGSKYGEGTYQVLWDTQRGQSSSYEGVVNYDLD
jgi:hypothetical protein